MIPCITEPVEEQCCIADLCFQCRLTMPDSVDFSFDIKVSNYFVVISLFAVGIWNILAFSKSYKLYRTNDQYNNYFPVMRLNNIIYAIGTGIFGLCKIYFQLSKPLLIFAAIHNLCEWVFVSFAFHKTKQQRMYSIFGSTCFILVVIGSIVNVFKEFDHFALAEQVTGIALDFMLPFVWFVLYIQNRNHMNINNKETSASSDFSYMYLVAFIAHSIHLLFTIIPLVIVNFVRNQNETFSRLLEFVLFLSVPLTHILYTHFTSIHERCVDLPAFAKNDNQNKNDNEIGVYSDNHSVQIPSFSFITNSFRRMLVWYIVFVIVGLFPTIIIPATIMKLNGGEFCPEAGAHDDVSSSYSSSSSSSLCPVEGGEAVIALNLADNDYIIGTSTAHIYDGMSESFEYYLKSKDLVKNARNFEGNLFYYLNKDMFVPNKYYIVEAWESKEAVEKWIKDPKDRAVWNNYTYNMLEGGQLELNGYVPLNPPYTLDENIGKGAIRHTFTSFDGCNDIGNALIDVSNCDFIRSCDHVQVLNEEKREQMLVFNNGWKLHCFVLEPKKVIAADGKITYTMIHQCENGVTERYELYEFPDEPEKCHLLLRFEVDLNVKTVDQLYDDYTSSNIPYVQKKYELSDCGNTKQNKSVLCQM